MFALLPVIRSNKQKGVGIYFVNHNRCVAMLGRLFKHDMTTRAHKMWHLLNPLVQLHIKILMQTCITCFNRHLVRIPLPSMHLKITCKNVAFAR